MNNKNKALSATMLRVLFSFCLCAFSFGITDYSFENSGLSSNTSVSH